MDRVKYSRQYNGSLGNAKRFECFTRLQTSKLIVKTKTCLQFLIVLALRYSVIVFSWTGTLSYTESCKTCHAEILHMCTLYIHPWPLPCLRPFSQLIVCTVGTYRHMYTVSFTATRVDQSSSSKRRTGCTLVNWSTFTRDIIVMFSSILLFYAFPCYLQLVSQLCIPIWRTLLQLVSVASNECISG